MKIHKTNFGSADLYHLKNKNDVTVEITNFGGIIRAIRTPDRVGKLEDIVLGFDNLASYQAEHPYFGAIIGRYANRIANGKFSINDVEYHLATNNGTNALHGGKKGFDKYFWKATSLETNKGVGVVLTHTSPDMEEGYPGNLAVKVTYLLNNANELLIRYEAKTDKPTVINLTNHTYFNLKGAGKGNILEHELRIAASRYTPVDANLIPRGIADVENTPFDFRKLSTIGARIAADNEQLQFGNGYDHNFVLDHSGTAVESVASVYERETGRSLEVLTSKPGVQFYTANCLDGTMLGKGNIPYQKRTAFCLETQYFPDAPNQSNFPAPLLYPDEKYHSETVYRFGVR